MSDNDEEFLADIARLLLSFDCVVNAGVFFSFIDVDLDAVKEWARRGITNDLAASESFSQLEHLDEKLGKAGSKSLQNFLVTFIKAIRHRVALDRWGAVLTGIDEAHYTAIEVSGLSPDKTAFVAGSIQRHVRRLNATEVLVTSLNKHCRDSRSASDWDYARYHDYCRESDLVSPFDFLSGFLDADGVHGFLKQITSHLTGSEMLIFTAWIATIAATSTRIPDQSFSPDALVRLLDDLKIVCH